MMEPHLENTQFLFTDDDLVLKIENFDDDLHDHDMFEIEDNSDDSPARNTLLEVKYTEDSLCQSDFSISESEDVEVVDVFSHSDNEESIDGIVVNDGYQCNVCEQIFDHASLLITHMNEYTKCRSCDRVFCSRLLYKLHVASHAIKKIFECDQCPATFGVELNFEKHKYAHRTGSADLSGAKRFPCRICQFRFVTHEGLNEHMRTHVKKKRTSVSMFECAHCAKCFTNKSTLIRHIVIHTNEKPFKCPRCDKCFRQKDYLQCHIAGHDNNLECDICKATFKLKASIVEHMKRHHLYGKEFMCDFCDKKLASRFALQNHVKMHTKEGLFSCDICDRTYQSEGNLKNHIRTHSGQRPFECDFCSMKFKGKGGLKKHLRAHFEEKVKCEYCQRKFSSGYYPIHLRLHTGVKPYECTFCGKRFAQCSGLKNHEVMHTGHKPFECSHCSRRFSYSSHRTRHVIAAHGGGATARRCSVCDKRFASSAALESHRRSHTGEKPFACDLCEKRFSQKSNLQSHKKLHVGGQKPFKCTLCDLSFFTLSKLKYHLTSHSNKRPFACNLCDKTFKHRSSLNEHIACHTARFDCGKCQKTFSTKSNLAKHSRKHAEEIVVRL